MRLWPAARLRGRPAGGPAAVRPAGPALEGGPALPRGTDWTWRPAALAARLDVPRLDAAPRGADFGGLEPFHEAPEAAPALAQHPGEPGGAPFAVEIAARAAGGYLSFGVPLPAAALAGLTQRHILRVDLAGRAAPPLWIGARANLASGPNTDRLEAPWALLGAGEGSAPAVLVFELDLAENQFSPARLKGGWIDLMFGEPAERRVTLTELVVSRHLRAEV